MSVEETNSIKDHLLQNSIKTATINNEKDISKNNTESFPFLKDWSDIPSDILENILKYFSEQELRKFASVCKNWCENIAMMINARAFKQEAIGLMETKPSTSSESVQSARAQKIRVIPTNLLKEQKTENDILELSSSSDSSDIDDKDIKCERFLGKKVWQTISSSRFSSPVRKSEDKSRFTSNKSVPNEFIGSIPRNPISSNPYSQFINNSTSQGNMPMSSNSLNQKTPSNDLDCKEPPNKKPKSILKVAVIDQNSRNGFICDQNWIIFRHEMCNAVLKYIRKFPNCTDPVFFYTGLENDRRWYQCDDNFSLNFLKSSVNEMKDIWKNASLKVETFQNIYQRSKAEICIQNTSLSAYEVTSIILSTNPCIKKSDILLSSYRMKPTEQTLLIDMTYEVSEFIRKQNCCIYFGLQQICVKFLDKNDDIIS